MWRKFGKKSRCLKSGHVNVLSILQSMFLRRMFHNLFNRRWSMLRQLGWCCNIRRSRFRVLWQQLNFGFRDLFIFAGFRIIFKGLLLKPTEQLSTIFCFFIWSPSNHFFGIKHLEPAGFSVSRPGFSTGWWPPRTSRSVRRPVINVRAADPLPDATGQNA